MKRWKAPLDFTQRVRVLHIRSGRDDSVWHGTHSDYLSTSSNHPAANSHQSSRGMEADLAYLCTVFRRGKTSTNH